MPYEDMIADEMTLMEEQLVEPLKSLGDHEIQVPLSSLMEEVTTIDSGSKTEKSVQKSIENRKNRSKSRSKTEKSVQEPAQGVFAVNE